MKDHKKAPLMRGFFVSIYLFFLLFFCQIGEAS